MGQQPKEDLRYDVLSYLEAFHRGRKNPIKAKDIASQFNINLRGMNGIIRQLRLQSYVIGSAKEPPFGYYLPATDLEAKTALDTYKDEVLDMLHILNVQKRAVKRFMETKKQPEFFNKPENKGQLAFIN